MFMGIKITNLSMVYVKNSTQLLKVKDTGHIQMKIE